MKLRNTFAEHHMNGNRRVNGAEHVSVNRALEGLQRKGSLIVFQSRNEGMMRAAVPSLWYPYSWRPLLSMYE